MLCLALQPSTLAGRVTGVLSPNTLCQALAGMSQPTLDRYLAYLQEVFLVFSLVRKPHGENHDRSDFGAL
jgi:predicted AAA+ superfamily ATPase